MKIKKKKKKKEGAILFWNIYGLNLSDDEMLRYIRDFDIILTEAWIQSGKTK